MSAQRSRQQILDDECAQYEGDGRGMAQHLRDVHGVTPEYDQPDTQGAWSVVADQHVEAHLSEEAARR